jgi:hypothetical protein
MQKRDPVKREYFPYSIPKEWYCPLYLQDMETIINCISCWGEKTFWECYTSKHIHTEDWFWYPVCENCYNKEVKKEYE